jgi:hypothetical protein
MNSTRYENMTNVMKPRMDLFRTIETIFVPRMEVFRTIETIFVPVWYKNSFNGTKQIHSWYKIRVHSWYKIRVFLCFRGVQLQVHSTFFTTKNESKFVLCATG